MSSRKEYLFICTECPISTTNFNMLLTHATTCQNFKEKVNQNWGPVDGQTDRQTDIINP